MKVTILHPVRHDGKSHAPGASLDLPNQAAEALIACGSAEATRRAAKPDAPIDPSSTLDPAIDPAEPKG